MTYEVALWVVPVFAPPGEGALERHGACAKEPTLYPWGQRAVHLIDPAGVCWQFA